MTNDNRQTLAVFFDKDKESKCFKVHTFAMAEQDPNSALFVFKSGIYNESDSSRFNYQGQFAEALLTDKEVEIMTGNESESENDYLFIFKKEYIEAYAKENNISYEEACLKLAQEMNGVELHNENFNSFTDCEFYTLKIEKNEENKIDINILEAVLNQGNELDNVLPSFNLSSLYDLKKMVDEIRSKIVGQDEAIITLATNIYYNQLLIDELEKDYYIDPAELDSRKVGILLDGTTGTGKSAILKYIASKLDLPITIHNANSFSETGYVGPSITDILRKLYILASKNTAKAERGIVVLDEIDKLATKNSADGKDMKKGVQEELLGFISGGTYTFPLEDTYGSPSITFDTSKLTFILSGAFTNLRDRKINEEKKKSKHIGFGGSNEVSDGTYTVSTQDYVDEGLNREFFGRVKVLTCTKTYTYDDLKNILLTSTISPLKNIEKTVRMFGYFGIVYDEVFLDNACNQALEMQTGARALQTIMSGIQNRLLRGLMNREYDLDKPIELTTNLLQEYNNTLVRKFEL